MRKIIPISGSVAIILTVGLLLIGTCGCGYKLKATGEPTGINMENISIPMIESTSSSLGFESDFTRVIREEFTSHTKIPLVSKADADYVLFGKISEIKTQPYSYNIEKKDVQGHNTTHELTGERWLKIKLHARLVEKSTGKLIWEDKNMEEKRTFSVGTDPLTNRYNQRQAIEWIARTLSKRIYLKTVERF